MQKKKLLRCKQDYRQLSNALLKKNYTQLQKSRKKEKDITSIANSQGMVLYTLKKDYIKLQRKGLQTEGLHARTNGRM